MRRENGWTTGNGESGRAGGRGGTCSRRARGEATDLACKRLLRLAHDLGPNTRLPGLRALSQEIGVSPGTLNLALDRLERQRILVRRERSGVFVAPSLGRRNVCLICSPDVLLDTSTSPFWPLLIGRIRTLAQEHETHLTIGFSHAFIAEADLRRTGDPTPLPDYLQTEITSGSLHGVLAVNLPHPVTRWIEEQGVPVVAFAGPARYSVLLSQRPLVEQGVAALVEAGCKNIELWIPDSGHFPQTRAWLEAGFHKTLSSFTGIQGKVFCEAQPDTPRNPSRSEIGYHYARARFDSAASSSQRPDGILLVDDILAQGVLVALTRQGIVPGRDVTIATYANAGSPALLGWQDQVIRIEYDLGSLVEMLFETLEDLMDNVPESLTEEYIPDFEYSEPEYLKPAKASERFRLVLPRLVRPSPTD
jgi:DNA-binding LacI/PurR family transcriptional regulator